MNDTAGMNEEARRKTLQLLLTAKRACIDPYEVGKSTPPSRGRRAAGKGLTQNHAAELLLVDRTLYEKLETGKLTSPDPGLLRRVAELYRLTEDEWRWLWQLTRRQNPPHLLHASLLSIPGGWHKRIGRIPDPAYIVDYRGIVRLANRAWMCMFPFGEAPSNPWEYMLCEPSVRGTILLDWETAWAPEVARQIRWSVTQFPNEPELRRIEQRVLDDPAARKIYEEFGKGLAQPDGQVRPFVHAWLGQGWLEIDTASLDGSPYSRLCILEFHPGATPPAPLPPLLPPHGQD